MNTLNTKTLSLFALASLSAISLSAVGVDDSSASLATPTSGDDASYTLEEAVASDYGPSGDSASSYDIIIKYVANADGSLTAHYYNYAYEEGVEFERQVVASGADGGDIVADFIGGVSDTALSGTINGGLAVNNVGNIDSITGDFIGNYLRIDGGTNAILLNSGSIGTITGDFLYNFSRSTNNKANVNGGVIFNSGATATIDKINGDFVGNYAQNITTSSSSYGARGGAIWNYNGATITAIEGSFINNFAQSYKAGGFAAGGAVLNSVNSTIGFLAETKDTQFTGNFTLDGSTYTSNAIANTGTVNFNAYNGYTITVNDGIDNTVFNGTITSTTRGTININGAVYAVGDTTTNIYANSGDASKVIFNNEVKGQDITVHAGTLELGSYAGGLAFSIDTSDLYASINASSVVSYTTKASVASMVNSTVIVNSGAILQIASSGVSFDADSSLTLSSGSKILLDASASLIFAEGASLTYTDAIFVVDLSDFLSGDLSYTLFTFENDTTSAESLYTYLTDDAYFTITSDGSYEVDSYELSLDGESIVLSITGTAVPEPSTYAMIIGILALGFAYYKRRK